MGTTVISNRLPIGRKAREQLKEGAAVLAVLALALKGERAGGEWVDAREVAYAIRAADTLLAKITYIDIEARPEWRAPPPVREDLVRTVQDLRDLAAISDERDAGQLLDHLAPIAARLAVILEDDDRMLKAAIAEAERRGAA